MTFKAAPAARGREQAKSDPGRHASARHEMIERRNDHGAYRDLLSAKSTVSGLGAGPIQLKGGAKARKKEKKKMEQTLSPKSAEKSISELSEKEVQDMFQSGMGISASDHGMERIKGTEGRERLTSAGIDTTEELFHAIKSASLVDESTDKPHKNQQGKPQRFYTIAQGKMFFCVNPVTKTLITITYK
jgi:hypothetical protein